MVRASPKRAVALLTPAFYLGGGVPSVVEFLYRILLASGEFLPEVISLATSARDPTSLRITSIPSWFRGSKLESGNFQGIPYRHFGAVLGELEFQRYRARAFLSHWLRRFDLVQVVA